MFRKVAVTAVLVALVLLGGVLGTLRMTAVTVAIGSGPIASVQSGPITTGTPGTATLASPSTAGTALVLVAASATGSSPAVLAMPAGWVQLISQTQGTQTDYEVWVYLNNPGGISAVTWTDSLGFFWYGQISEWANVLAASALDASGGANATAGTTLAPVVTNPITKASNLVISGWLQRTGIVGTVSFATPTGFTRLADDGSVTLANHLDLEYQINAALGTRPGPTLTSDTASASSAGAIIVLGGAIPITDISAYISFGSMTIKQNTVDFGLTLGGKLTLEDGSGFYQLEDGSGVYLLDTYVPQLGDPVTVTISP